MKQLKLERMWKGFITNIGMAQEMGEHIRDNWMMYAGVGGGAVILGVIIKRYKSSSATVWPKDTVVLHQLPRGPWVPNHSPFPLKVETYLRMSGTPYVIDFDNPMSQKGKTPWISYNGEDVADSELSILYLNKKLDINLNRHLTNEQQAVATAFQRLVDEHLYWCLLLWRWHYQPGLKDARHACRDFSSNPLMAVITKIVFERNLNKQAWGQGMGRHTEAEVFNIADTDLRAVSDYIGTKLYLTGAQPCEQDCAVFAMLATIAWQFESPMAKMIAERYPNLQDYCTRMKERFWPDWDQCITHGYTVKATK